MVDRAVPGPATALRVMIEWAADQPLLPGRAYAVARGEQTETATIAPLHYRLDPASGEHVAARTLARGEVGACDIELSRPLRLEPGPGETAVHFEVRDLRDGALLGAGSANASEPPGWISAQPCCG